MNFTLYMVGGYVRDDLLGLPSKDIDFTVVGTTYSQMLVELEDAGFRIILPVDDGPSETEASKRCRQMLTVRAKAPKGWTFGKMDLSGKAVDFVLARKEGDYTDGRHPDEVAPGTLADDLRRRDFTVNALARDEYGALIDMFGGRHDIHARVLRCVGDPQDRFTEDALRALRAIRFAVTKDMALHGSVRDALASEWLPPLLASVSVERRAKELLTAFRHDTMRSVSLLMQFPYLMKATFQDGLWLMPTLRA